MTELGFHIVTISATHQQHDLKEISFCARRRMRAPCPARRLEFVRGQPGRCRGGLNGINVLRMRDRMIRSAEQASGLDMLPPLPRSHFPAHAHSRCAHSRSCPHRPPLQHFYCRQAWRTIYMDTVDVYPLPSLTVAHSLRHGWPMLANGISHLVRLVHVY